MRATRIAAAATAMSLVVGCASTPPAAPANPFPDAEAPGAKDDSNLELANKQVVLQYYEAVNNAKDFTAASRFVVAHIRLHDPTLTDGLDGLRAHIQALIKDYPQARVDVKRVLTSGDRVFLHSHAVRTPGTVGYIAGDIFRLENGKIAEQWTVLHPIPEKPHPDNPNGPF